MRKVHIVLVGPVNGIGGVASLVNSMVGEVARRGYRISVLPSAAPSGVRAIRRMFYQVGCYLRFVRAVATGRSLIHVHPSFRPRSLVRDAVFVLLARGFGCPVVAHFHGGTPNRACVGLARVALIMFARLADQVVVLTQEQQSQWQQRFPYSQVRVIPNGVPPQDRPESSSVARDISALFLGRVIREKGIYDFLEVARILAHRTSDRVCIAGDGPDLQAVAAECEADSRLANVQIVGFVAGPTKAELLARSKVLVLPSYDEALPLAALEAMAHGIPVVAYDVGGVGDVVADESTGRLCSLGDVGGLSHAVLSLVRDDELRQAMGCAARKHVNGKFAFLSFCDRVEDVYRRLAEEMT